MKGLMSKLFHKNKGPGATLTQFPFVPLRYQMHCVGWHMDNRPRQSLILVHDLLSSSNAWSPFAAEVSKLPCRGFTPSTPLQMYAVDLRNHGRSPRTAKDENTIWHYVHDIVRFTQHVVTQTGNEAVHLVGQGLGGRVAMLAALASPNLFESVVAIGDTPSTDRDSPVDMIDYVKGFRLSPTIAGCEKMMKPVLRNEFERLALLSNVDEAAPPKTGVEPSPSQWAFNLPVLEPSAPTIGRWPADSFLKGLSFSGTALFVNNVNVDPLPAMATLFPKNAFACVPGQWESRVIAPVDAPALVDCILRQTDLLSEVRDPTDAAEQSAS